jgi:putative Mn2+ efflux pump MntP
VPGCFILSVVGLVRLLYILLGLYLSHFLFWYVQNIAIIIPNFLLGLFSGKCLQAVLNGESAHKHRQPKLIEELEWKENKC